VVIIKRKIVKHGPSSFIVSLPLKWVKRHNLSKGDEVDVQEVEEDVVISTTYKEKFERAEINLKDNKEILEEHISALYKRGIDEIKIFYTHPEDFKLITKALSLESMGYEIVETNPHSCTIRCITKLTKEFDAILRRVFLVTLSLADEGLKAINSCNFDALDNIKFLEKSNNKLTTFCRRYLNKYSTDSFDRIGAIYFIVELLEKIADEYKYLYAHGKELCIPKNKINSSMMEYYTKINAMLRTFYECFYKFDNNKIRDMKIIRKELIDGLNDEFQSGRLKSNGDFDLYHHALVLVEKIYSLADPFLVLNHNK